MNNRRLPESITSFCACFMHDPKITDQSCVLLVHNIADKDRPNEDPLYDGSKPRKQKSGKRAGFGLPGGGQRIGNMETAEETAANELESETGFKPEKLKGLFVQSMVFISVGERKIHTKLFVIGQDPSYFLPNRGGATINHVCIFRADINWEGSALQKLLHQLKAEWLASGQLSQEDIDQEGLWVNIDKDRGELTEEELALLNIEEDDEIDMIGIFPLHIFSDALREKFPKWSSDFYPLHIMRIAEVCIRENIHKEEFESAFIEFKMQDGYFTCQDYHSAYKHLSKLVL